MTDAELLAAMLADFRSRYQTHTKIQSLLAKVENGTAAYADAQQYATEVSKLIGKVWQSHFSQFEPGQARSMSRKVLPAVMDENYERVAAYVAPTQKALNEKANIHLQVQVPPENEDRIDGLQTVMENAESYEDAESTLLTGMENFSQNIVDESVRLNADLHSRVGLRPKIVRRTLGSCCKWCRDLAGVYDYEDVRQAGHDVWRRHANCDCLIEYDPGNGRRETVNNYRPPESRDKIEERKKADEEFEQARKVGRQKRITTAEANRSDN